LSVKAAPVKATAFGFVSRMVSVEVPPTGMLAGVNDLATSGGANVTVSELVAGVVFDPPLVVISPPAGMILSYVPPPLAVTVIVTVQLPVAGIVPPVRLTEVVVWVAVPPQVVPAVPGRVVKPVGRLSLNVAPVRATGLGFDRVMVRSDVPPGAMVPGTNALATVGGSRGGSTMGVGTLLLPGLPSLSGSGFVPFWEGSVVLPPLTAPVPEPLAVLLNTPVPVT
jgi:hypothetical protein